MVFVTRIFYMMYYETSHVPVLCSAKDSEDHISYHGLPFSAVTNLYCLEMTVESFQIKVIFVFEVKV